MEVMNINEVLSAPRSPWHVQRAVVATHITFVLFLIIIGLAFIFLWRKIHPNQAACIRSEASSQFLKSAGCIIATSASPSYFRFADSRDTRQTIVSTSDNRSYEAKKSSTWTDIVLCSYGAERTFLNRSVCSRHFQ